MPFIASWSSALALVLSVVSIAAVLVGYGRWLEKLNGMGKRVSILETEATLAKSERGAFAVELRRMVDNVTMLTREIGKHERNVEVCREDTEKLGISIGSEIHKLTGVVAALDKHLSVEIATVQTILKERGIGNG